MNNGYKLVKYFKLNEVMNWGLYDASSFDAWQSNVAMNTAIFTNAITNCSDINLIEENFLNFDYKDEYVKKCFLQVCRKYENEYVFRKSFNSLDDANNFVNTDETLSTYNKTIKKFVNVFEKTYAYYHALLKGYSNVESELLEQIKEESTTTSSDSSSSDSTSTTSDTNKTTNNLEEKTTFDDATDVESQFNDTPQNSTEPFADGFTTNANKSTTSKTGNDTTTNTGTTETSGSGTNTTKGSGKSEGTSTTTRTIPYTPMQRLIEVQNAYKNVLAQWVNEFKVIVIEQQGDEEDEEF